LASFHNPLPSFPFQEEENATDFHLELSTAGPFQFASHAAKTPVGLERGKPFLVLELFFFLRMGASSAKHANFVWHMP
jgi:hypothetical protein